ncbi:MAG: hypothetical protein PW786_07730 [Arachidicoccus sp.]|nr:hypothetical protein [Arachidicoccus sp.]
MNKNFITAYCIAENNIVYKNGLELYATEGILSENFFLSAYNHFNLNYPKFYKMDNLSKLGWLASEILLKDENLHEHYASEDIGIVLSNANASLDTDLNYSETIKDIPSPAVFVYTLPNIVIGEISIRNGFKGENAFFISEKFDAALLEQYVNILFSSNACQSCICGWTETLEDNYKCVLFLVEKEKRNLNLEFIKDNLEAIFNANAEG